MREESKDEKVLDLIKKLDSLMAIDTTGFEYKEEDIIKIIEKKDISSLKDEYNNTPLHLILFKDMPEKKEETIKGCRKKECCSVLECSSLNFDLNAENVKLLLEYKSDINAYDKSSKQNYSFKIRNHKIMKE